MLSIIQSFKIARDLKELVFIMSNSNNQRLWLLIDLIFKDASDKMERICKLRVVFKIIKTLDLSTYEFV